MTSPLFQSRWQTSFLVFLTLSFTASLYAQRPTASPTPDDTVRITTSLVQLDVVVTDKDGKTVPNLRPEDFQIYQDGKLRTITNVQFIDSQTGEKTQIAAREQKPEKIDKKVITPPPANVRSPSGRIITFVLDDGDCQMTLGDMNLMIDTMKKIINQQMQPGDRMAIYRTARGASLIPIYTANKDVLLQNLSKIHLQVQVGGCASAFDPATNVDTGKKGGTFETQRDKDNKAATDNKANSINMVGNLFVLNAAIERLTKVDGRKILFFLGEGIPLTVQDGDDKMPHTDSDTFDALSQIAKNALKASVVINTVSIRGVTNPGMIEAADDVSPDNTTALAQARVNADHALKEGPSLLAEATGGVSIHDQNFPEGTINRTLDKQTAYYLISYEPDEETFKGKAFHKIEVKLTRPELRAVSRNGFYGRTDNDTRPVYKTADSPMYQAMDSPLAVDGMNIGLTILKGNTAATGNFARPLFHINGDDLTFVDDASGGKKVVVDVVAVTLDEQARLVNEFNRTYTAHIPKDGVPMALRNGLDFATDIPIKRPGTYSLRLAVRDQTSKRLGSASDYFEIDDVTKGKFAIAGLITTGIDDTGSPALPKSRTPELALSLVPELSVPSIRKYTHGMRLYYTYTIYNAKLDPTTQMPHLTRQVRLYNNGNLVFDGPETPTVSSVPTDPLRINDFGNILVTNGVKSGEYAIQIIVRDRLANKASTQWIDFEVVD